MAKNGEPGRALGLAAVSSVLGGIFSLIVFIFAAPLLAQVALEFGPQEYFGLAIFALSMLATIRLLQINQLKQEQNLYLLLTLAHQK